MEATKLRNIKSGIQYDHLFPKANIDTQTVVRQAGVDDTVAFIPQVVNKTLHHTKGIAGVLKGYNDYETCRNIWQFVYGHIAYRKDKEGYEQVRSPARTWHDRKAGVDCDCYTTFISSILKNLKIPHKLRITKYSKDYFQHIYPIAFVNGKQVVLDCVTDQFDYEVPYSEQKDYPMDLQYLNGIDGIDGGSFLIRTDRADELGKLFKKKTAAQKAQKKTAKAAKKQQRVQKRTQKKQQRVQKKTVKKQQRVQKKQQRVQKRTDKKAQRKAAKNAPGNKKGVKKLLNVVNKVNPATVVLRNGVLASMKLNIGNVAKRLRWSYVTTEQAQSKGMDMARWQKLVEARKKLENIFYGAGGKPENLKKAILGGKGNSDNAVSGFDGIGALLLHRDAVSRGAMRNHARLPMQTMSSRTPLRQLLGDEMFYSENNATSLGELGEPVSAAAIAAAAGVIAAIASTIKKIGDIFGGKGEGSGDFDEAANAEAENEIPEPKEGDVQAEGESGGGSEDGGDSEGGDSESGGESGGGGDDGGPEEGGTDGGETLPAKAPASPSGGSDGGDSSGNDKPKGDFIKNNKKWLVPVGIGIGAISLIAILAKSMRSTTTSASPKRKKGKALNGTPKKKRTARKSTAGGKTAKSRKKKLHAVKF